MQPIIKLQVHGPAATVTLNRPEKRNALSRQLLKELQQTLDDLYQERKVRAVILTAAGSAFSGGMDLEEMHSAADQEDRLEQWRADAVQYHELMETMLRFPKPLIASVNGPAVAGGAGLVLACDMVVASRTASFGFPEPRRGIVAGMVAPLLAFRLGAARAAQMLLTARTFSAEEMLTFGLYGELVDDDKIWARARQIVDEIARSAPEAIQLTKRLLNETIGESLFSQLAAGAAISASSRTIEAAAEGLRAFLEKREPQWW
jgi:methylglutaconyl-CoA hydratase